MRAVLGILTALILLGLAMPGPAAIAQEAGAELDLPYTLKPGDTLIVNVLEDPTLDAEALVLPDGRISLPVAGTIEAGGMTPEQVQSLVRQRLGPSFVEPPTVTVRVTSLAQGEEEDLLAFYVLGEVARPGRYEFDPEEPVTIMKALSLAGGLGPFAARERIQVREMIGDTQVLRLFDYEAFEDGQISNSRDLADLSDGTVIVVPERGLFE